ncbi:MULTISPECIES: hypothetical protein [unclassified Mesorhizobium]|uniref:hypothetical protein n=1 Tax=unclassified Mesorhizobium TaxID=325217 RepID=UPI000FDB140E|nr:MULTISPECIES: hypothetical protein [unclassified Mesorhizobium]TGT64046.1 hypothetical protein EN809_034890 [Mesorhizobium sp. M2E.F.Ca.ET.166.01.1.1]TGV97070.1 hypothetical protein EN797_035270 [Mesorhizobium sp. M2E.F.Ca.ET.154.01.1.1]
MTTHIFTRVIVRDGAIISREAKSLSDEELFQRTNHVGRSSFLELLNKWNRIGLLGHPNGGPVYIYIAGQPG